MRMHTPEVWSKVKISKSQNEKSFLEIPILRFYSLRSISNQTKSKRCSRGDPEPIWLILVKLSENQQNHKKPHQKPCKNVSKTDLNEIAPREAGGGGGGGGGSVLIRTNSH